jgi:hypothetical protein
MQMAVGAYQTACESSPNKIQIDQWLNEDKSSMWISRELKMQFGETISDKSITKYRKYRQQAIQTELEKQPDYQAKIQAMNEHLVNGIGQIREVDVISKLADTIDDCAEMLADARDRDVQIKNVQDMRFVSQTMLDAIKIYGDTVLKAQRFNKVENDPTLLKPVTISVGAKDALKDILKEVMNDGNGYELIDKLRNGIRGNVGGGIQGDIGGSGSGIVDGEPQNT